MNTKEIVLTNRTAIEAYDLYPRGGRQVGVSELVDGKVLPRPMEVLAPRGTRAFEGAIVHSSGVELGRDEIVALSPGLMCLSPAAAVLRMLRGLNLPQSIVLIDELCGTFRRPRKNAVVLYAQKYHANRVHYFPTGAGPNDCQAAAFYKIDPLITVAQLEEFARTNSNAYGSRAALRALPFCTDGLGSYLETEFHLLAFLPLRYGGCALPRPTVNYRIDLPERLQAICGKPYIIADDAWVEERVAVELLGVSDHGGDSITETSVREKVYSALEWKCLTATKREIESTRLFMNLVRELSGAIGHRLRTDIKDFDLRQKWLQQELFVRGDERPPNRKSYKVLAAARDGEVPTDLRSMSYEECSGARW